MNRILTVNAVLLAALLWSQVAGAPLGSPAAAEPPSMSNSGEPGNGGGIPDAGLQRLQILNEIKALRADVQRLDGALSGGKMKVVIGNPGDIKLNIDYAKLKDAFKNP